MRILIFQFFLGLFLIYPGFSTLTAQNSDSTASKKQTVWFDPFSLKEYIHVLHIGSIETNPILL